MTVGQQDTTLSLYEMGNYRILSGSVLMEASLALLLKHRIMSPCQTLANLKYSARASGKEQELVCCYQEGCCCFLTSGKHKKKTLSDTHLMGSCSMSEDSSYRGSFEFIFGGSQDDSADGEEEAAPSVESSMSSLSSEILGKESELNSSSS
ncbi:hypothetical protein C4D60_Mb09t00160 [Musa balbisiana]|uniref:Uncharacterized protein n=1 Tax=Musa balbisiana TaxID=52838 RepID=A0A4V4H2X1_MUSBA|nr:hypothetical protein C4D60_Mb09t00160 [Musa balbisiana]